MEFNVFHISKIFCLEIESCFFDYKATEPQKSSKKWKKLSKKKTSNSWQKNPKHIKL